MDAVDPPKEKLLDHDIERLHGLEMSEKTERPRVYLAGPVVSRG
jgi:hypothetical protein